MPKTKDQAQNVEQSSEEVKPEGLDEQIEAGFKEFDKDLEKAKAEETKKEETKPEKEVTEKEETKVEAKDEECKECPEGKKRADLTVEDIDWKSIDYRDGEYPKPMKVDGKVEWIEDAAHHDELTSMGYGFTQKTTAHAEVKKTELEQMAGYTDMMKNYVEQFNTIADSLKGRLPEVSQTKPQTSQPEPTETQVKAKIYEEFDIDPEFADTRDKKYVDETYRNRLMLSKLQAAVVMQNLKAKAVDIREAVIEARKEHPFKEVLDKKTGENLTQLQFGKLFQAKAKDDPQRPWDEIAVECAKDIYLMQKGKEVSTSTQDINKMTPAQFKVAHPELYEKISTDEGEKAVVQHEEEKSEIPPSLKPANREVEVPEKKGKGEFEGLTDAIDKAFKEVPLHPESETAE